MTQEKLIKTKKKEHLILTNCKASSNNTDYAKKIRKTEKFWKNKKELKPINK